MTDKKGKESKEEQMVRVRTKTHLSPFVFPRDIAIKKVAKLSLWLRNESFSIVPVTEYDPIMVWKPTHPVFDLMMSDQIEMLKHMEDSWPT